SKLILRGITGEFQSGQLTAILGPSGAGKSTLTFLGRVTGAGGQICTNSEPRDLRQFRKLSRYIMQEDLLQPLITLVIKMTVPKADMIHNIKKSQSQGHNIQAAARLFAEFDHVYVVADGRCAYQGTSAGVVPFLKELQLICPTTYNPADFVIEVSSGEYGFHVDRMVAAVDNGRNQRWRDYAVEDLVEEEVEIEQLNAGGVEEHCYKYGTTPCEQFCILLRRMLLQNVRNRGYLHLRVCLYLFLGFLIGALFSQMGYDASKAMFNFGFCYACVIAMFYIPMMPVLLAFPSEVQLVKREYFNRWYGLKPYYAALVVSRTPATIFFSLIYISITYPLTSQPMELPRILMFTTICLVTALISESMGTVISATLSVVVSRTIRDGAMSVTKGGRRIPTPMPPPRDAHNHNNRSAPRLVGSDASYKYSPYEMEALNAVKSSAPKMDRNGYFFYVASTAKKKKISLMQPKPPRVAFVDKRRPGVAERIDCEPVRAVTVSVAPDATENRRVDPMTQRGPSPAPRARLYTQLESYQPRYHTIRESSDKRVDSECRRRKKDQRITGQPQAVLSSGSPHRQRRREEDAGSASGFCAALHKAPPPPPPALLRRLGVKEPTGVGKPAKSFHLRHSLRYDLIMVPAQTFSLDKRKKQVSLCENVTGAAAPPEDRKVGVAAPKMFAFDAIFSQDDSQTEICSSALTDVIHAVINGTDGCLFCFGHAGLDTEQSPGVYLRDDPLFGTHLQNQSELRVHSAEKAAFYLDAALATRGTREEGKDSHLLYTLHVYQYSLPEAGVAYI
ncbi:hypothetical protein MSG28_006351, partial [Choristoneura fumiferana]